MRKCTLCALEKEESAFSWTNRNHQWRDSRCRACRARLQKQRRIPKDSHKPYTFYRHLSPEMYQNTPKETLAYVAGLVDGEGCITSSLPKSNAKPLSTKVSMIHRPTVLWLHETFGGWFGRHKTRQENARQSWSWQLGGARSYALLQQLLPFLRVKREEAETALRLGYALCNDEQVRGKVTEEALIHRRILGQELRNLKRREWTA